MMKIISAFLLKCMFLVGSNLYGLAIEPLRLFLKAEPGETVSGEIALYNDKAVTVAVNVELLPFKYSRVPVDEWLMLNQGVFRMEPNQKTVLNYRIKLPPHAKGEYYARIRYLEKAESEAEGEDPIAVNLSVTVPFFVTVKGTEIHSFNISNFGHPDETGSQFSIELHNQGNVHVTPHGECMIISLDTNELIHTVILGSPDVGLYPGKTKTIDFETARPLPPGTYQATFEFSLFKGKRRNIKERFEFIVE